MKMNSEELLKKGLIKKAVQSKQSASKRMKKARRWLDLASKLAGIDLDTALEKTYDAVLESGMALLAKDGFRATSKLGHHFAVMEYLSNAIDIDGSALHTLRKNRNVIIYEDEEDVITEDYVNEAIEFAADIVKKSKKLIDSG